MIDTRKCSSQEELELAMQYTSNKTILKKIEGLIFDLEHSLSLMTEQLSRYKQIKEDLREAIDAFEDEYYYMIVEEK